MRILLLIILFFPIILPAQEAVNNTQLALIYFQNKNFDKAAVFYLELYEQTGAKVYFDYYIKCLAELGENDNAEKFIKKQIKKWGNSPVYTIELGAFYKQTGSVEKANSIFETIIKKLPDSQNEIISIANTFLSRQEFEWAEKVYLQAKKNLKEYFTLSFELAHVYYLQRNHVKMIDEYLNLLEESDSYIQSVQNRLQNQVYDATDTSVDELLKTQLLKRIQKKPDKIIFSELLIWLYIQEQNFESAFHQSKALDKRNKEEGDRLMLLGNIAASNYAFDVAVNCYKYVIDKGSANEFYISAKTDYLNTLYQKIVLMSEFTNLDLLELESNFISTLKEIGENPATFPLIKNLAHIQAFYLNKADTAINMLERLLKSSALKPSQISECKVELADIMLFDDDPWQASLYYAQVEKANKQQPIGHEAKFRKARLAYYTGDYRWAEAQLDVLKASTSKLIANDALYLALLINDNIDLEFDTLNIALTYFSEADLLIYRNKDSLAMLKLDSILILYSSHPLADDILYKKYEIKMKQKKYTEAAAFLQKIIDLHSTEILGDKALFQLAFLNEIKLKDTEKAKDLYRTLLTKFPGSIYIPDARKRFRKLRGDVID
ncbi:MAG: hypothetical protein A2309_09175 [Bacteroidetes bacterium RIFOXYB2_FULL_35_7]|nr:MAG: hypothetical protein A2X01_04800 [Bacteroidetes bacterium GWF2_35_48]OFY96509.1 MAG: hypothetical protein A2309_09175 [Bacteroidetes bacterium RIFOXYB2_FULL_35_7]OFZ06245.1 MAG: hypothetical protein A2491_13480 [Bacteroidetes bacterium RIFOXYC12_FULL_35_7]HBX51973.1 hypothetical protein [Bacteroidales bacterium]